VLSPRHSPSPCRGLAGIDPPPAARQRWSDGPVPGYTGGFGEPTCTTCHFDAPAELTEDELTIEGVPGRFEPGTRYELAVVLRDPRLERAGFQLAARYADGPEQGRQAGELSALGERAEVIAHGEPPVLYARQTREGARPEEPGSARWTLAWTAPEDPSAAVVFHAAANAANYDDSELGDVVHSGSVRSEPPSSLTPPGTARPRSSTPGAGAPCR
jgi:hypothetical protein